MKEDGKYYCHSALGNTPTIGSIPRFRKKLIGRVEYITSGRGLRDFDRLGWITRNGLSQNSTSHEGHQPLFVLSL
jgi:hypothetical protein